MDRLTMAHEYFMKHVNTDQYRHLDDEDLISWSFDYVDAMQAEADKRECKERPDVLNMANSPQLEWQPDWSQSPDDAVAWVYSNVDKSGFWCHKKPIRLSRGWCTYTMLKKAPSFGYQGNWEDSLRERPHGF